MAADRAAALTEAYRILSNEARRAEYDRARPDGGRHSGAAARPPVSSGPPPVEAYVRPASRPQEAAAGETPRGPQFRQERATRDEFVRRAAAGRLRAALEAVGGGYDPA